MDLGKVFETCEHAWINHTMKIVGSKVETFEAYPFFLIQHQKLINYFQPSRALTTPNEDADDYQTFPSHFDINVHYAYSLVLQNKGQELGFKLASYSIHSQCRGLLKQQFCRRDTGINRRFQVASGAQLVLQRS
ncbi:hypothetical protein Scep_002742 [Stephania cephalantha]|uniref:Uncharacterized protein n=1 Tax=Stephania cephalantha TaxID=152367 RepID=A0AAP0LAS6_9MAGN